MESNQSPHSAMPFSFRHDHVGGMHLYYGKEVAPAAARFLRIQNRLLEGIVFFSSPSARLAAFLIAFDGAAISSDLSGALNGIANAYSWHDAVCLDWKDSNGRHNRRHLSVWTRSALAGLSLHSFCVDETLKELDASLSELSTLVEFPYGLDAYLFDSVSWLMLTLPGPIFAHAVGAAPLTALSRCTLAREECRLVLAPTEEMNFKHLPETDTGLGIALSGYFNRLVDDGSDWLIDDIAFRSRGKIRHKILSELLSLAATPSAKGPLSSLILAWAIDLAESGTRSKLDIASGTIGNYVSVAAKSLLSSFREKTLEALSGQQFYELYEKIIFSKPPGSQKTCASALHSWHFFLETWLDVAPCIKSFYRDLPVSIPRANILWPHEILRISSWLDSSTAKTRLIEQAKVAFVISSSIRIRRNELLKLRIKNIRVFENCVEVEICTLEIDGGLKSYNSRRVQEIRSAESAEVIESWVERRRHEMALPNDFLFGDPHHPERSFQLGQMYVLLNRILKDATGDQTVCLHTLSHTWVTSSIMEVSNNDKVVDINTYDQIATDAGQAGSHTTFEHYFHRFEEQIRHKIDEAILGRLRWPQIKSHVDFSHAAFRQRLSRHCRHHGSSKVSSFILELLGDLSPRLSLPLASKGIAICEPIQSASLSINNSIRFNDVFHALSDLSNGLSADVVACRLNLQESTIEFIAAHSVNLLIDIGEIDAHFVRKCSVNSTEVVRQAFRCGTEKRIQFSRSKQAKILSLRHFLESNRNRDAISEGVSSWQLCYRKGYLSLEDPSAASGLVRLLHAASIPRSSIVLKFSNRGDQALAAANSQFIPNFEMVRRHSIVESLFGLDDPVLPILLECSPRRGRPSFHMMISGTSSNVESEIQSATVGMSGFHSLLFVSAVLERFTRC